MQLPDLASTYTRLAQFGLYTVGRLTRKKQKDLADAVREVSLALITDGRAWDDAALESQRGYADRDAVDEDLDTSCRTIRQQLANRGLGADQQAPYSIIFPEGIDYYIKAPLDQQVQRYELFVSRLEANLPADDEVRTEYVAALKAQLEEFRAADKALATLLNEETLRRDRMEAGKMKWEKQLNDTWAALCTRYDKKKAENFFRRVRSRSDDA